MTMPAARYDKVQEDQSDFVKASNIPSYLNQLCLKWIESARRKMPTSTSCIRLNSFPFVFHSSLIYFPTKAVADPECIWINYYSIDYVNYRKKKAVPSFF